METATPGHGAWGSGAVRPYNILAKPIGPRCNIDCTYCYYLEKEGLYPDEKKFRMSGSVLEDYIRQHIETSQAAGMPEVSFLWQGGEPTMLGLDYFRDIVALQARIAPPGLRLRNGLQTNGILLDDDWARFFREHDFLIGISIDGPQKLHDRYRIDRAGRPTWKKVMQGLDVLMRHGVETNTLTSVHRANGGRGREVYRFLRGLGIAHMQFIPIVERLGAQGLARAPQIDMAPGNAVAPWSVGARAYGKFLCDVFDIWFRGDIGAVFVQHFDEMLGRILGAPGGLCIFAETCGDSLALEHDGALYACDHFVYPEYRLGRIADTPLGEMRMSERVTVFGEDKRDRLTAQCRACSWRFACNGGCPKHRFARAGDGEGAHNYFCEGYTMFLRHAGDRLREMARLVALGRPAREAAAKAR